MTPEALDHFLRVMRDRGVASAEVQTPDGTLRVVFGPDAGPLPGETPTPGGWKSPMRLDDPAQFDEAP